VAPFHRAIDGVLRIGFDAGGMTVSHANDSYFSVGTQFSKMDVATAYKAQTVATFPQGLTGMTVVAILPWIVL